MADPIREDINIGLADNDGTGDTLRAASAKTNRNFKAIWDTIVIPFAEKIGLIERVQGAFIPVQTYALRDQIPVSYRRYGFRVTVVEAFTDSAGKVQPLDFVWTQNRFPDAPEGQRDGWLSLRSEADLLNRGNHTGGQAQDTIFGLPQALTGLDNVDKNVIRAISSNAALQISSASIQASSANGPWTAMWWIDGVAPATQRMEWNGWSINLDGRARRFVLQTDWTITRQITFIGNSMTDANDIDAGGNWSGIYASRLGVAFTNVAKYSQDANKQALRSGAKKIRLSVDGDSIPAGGGTKNITLINGVAPGTDNPDSFLNTSAGDGVTVNNSITGTAAGRHMTISIPTGGSPAYKITVDAGQTAAAFPPGTIFVPDAAATMSVNEVHIDAGRITFFPLQPFLDSVALMVGMGRGNPITVWPILPADNDSATDRARFIQANAATAAAYPLLTPRVTVGGVTYDPLSYYQFRGGVAIDPNGNVPTQYHKGGDTLHWNTLGNNVRADFAELWKAQRARPPLLTFDTPVSWYAEATDGLGNPMTAYVLARPMLAPLGSTTNIVRPDFTNLETALAQIDLDSITFKDVLRLIRPLFPEMADGLRFRVGRRLFATLDGKIGFYFRKIRLPSTVAIDDAPNTPLINRLLTDAKSSSIDGLLAVFRFIGLEALLNGGMRWRIGRRLYGTLDNVNGFRFYKLMIPSTTVMDDQPTMPLIGRLLSGGIGQMLQVLPVELGGGIRARLGKRLMFKWTVPLGFEAPRMTLAADTKMADDMTRTLSQRLLAAGVVPNLLLLTSWGDSRTAGAGASAPNRYPEYIATLLAPFGITSVNRGIGGQTSIMIAARQGGWPLRLSVQGNTIPAAATPVAVTAYSTDIFSSSGNAFAAGSFAGTYSGVPGTFASNGATDGSGLTFTRTTAGAAITVRPYSPFILTFGKVSWNGINYICVGTNGAGTDSITLRVGDFYETVRLSKAMAQKVREAGGIPIVASVIGRNPNLNDDPAPNLLLNNMLKIAHGGDYLDILSPPTDEEIATANAALSATVGTFTLSAQDITDRNNGLWPRGFYGDTVHLNSWHQYINALRVLRFLQFKGLI